MSRWLVCDCSITAAWCLRDEHSRRARRVLDRLGQRRLLVPALWPAEMANVLATAERRGRLEAEDADRALELIARLPLEIEADDTGSAARILAVARARSLSAYDAAYLELAARRRAELATLDARLAAAAAEAGVRLHE